MAGYRILRKAYNGLVLSKNLAKSCKKNLKTAESCTKYLKKLQKLQKAYNGWVFSKNLAKSL